MTEDQSTYFMLIGMEDISVHGEGPIFTSREQVLAFLQGTDAVPTHIYQVDYDVPRRDILSDLAEDEYHRICSADPIEEVTLPDWVSRNIPPSFDTGYRG